MSLVPSSSARTGKSFEQPDGGALAVEGELNIDGNLYIDGKLVDSLFDSTLPKAVFAYDYPTTVTVEGWGHMMLNFGDNQAVTEKPLTAGTYRFDLTLTGGSGKTLDTVYFTVK
jgi:hypothetical protein